MKTQFLIFGLVCTLIAACGPEYQTEYYENGEVRIEVEVNPKGLRNGSYKEYYSDGTIKVEGHYKDGKMEGEYKEYYQDGALSLEATFKADSIFGNYTSYYPNKYKKKEVIYTPGSQTGKILEYYENGQVKTAGNMLNGKQDGLLTSYYENGQTEIIANFRNGVEHGEYQNFFKNGKIKLRAQIVEGSTIFYMQYDSTGALIDEKRIVTVHQPPLIRVGEVAHFDVNVSGVIGPNAYFQLLLTNDNLSPMYNEQTQEFRLLKLGTIKKSSYIYSFEDKHSHGIVSTGNVPASKIIEKTDPIGDFSVDITPKAKGSYTLLGVVNVISKVDEYGVEKLRKSYTFTVKYEVQ